jgi:P27 family predicted phage terminase small subunit
MAGKRRKTPEAEAAQGFPGHRKPKTQAEMAAIGRDDELSTPVSRLPSPPEWMTEPGRVVWEAVGADLVHRHILKPSDLGTLARYCDYVVMWNGLRAELIGRGGKLKTTYEITTAAGSKMKVPNPAFAQFMRLDKLLTGYEDRFGLNPQSRTALLTRLANIGQAPPRAGAGVGDDAGAEPRSGSPLGILNRKPH